MYLIRTYQDWLTTQPESVVLQEFKQGQAQVRELEREAAEEDPRASLLLDIWTKRLDVAREALTPAKGQSMTYQQHLELLEDFEQASSLQTYKQKLWLDPRTLCVMEGKHKGKHIGEVSQTAFSDLLEGQTISFTSQPVQRRWLGLFGKKAIPYTIKVIDALVKDA